MSERLMKVVLSRYPKKNASEMVLALVLASHANDSGSRICPTVAQIADDCGLCVRSVQRYLRDMQRTGWLQLVDDGGPHGRPNEYQINPERITHKSTARGVTK